MYIYIICVYIYTVYTYIERDVHVYSIYTYREREITYRLHREELREETGC